ncbi:4-coumarate--CoA ligase 1-like isoform X2 [Varroa destructor]|uniref:Uncharacterized protein n=1 Tax=Varroa destructor TaxID=109461 RepID=A0A7M7KBJ5_VARDE|nr:4-coumarate--CoA ligase 1-like isoform X2 [Varroa destructor]
MMIDARLGLQWSFAALFTRVKQLRAFLLRNGVSSGEHVAIHAYNGIETYTSIWAIACVPAVAVLIRPSFKYRETKSVLSISQCSTVITDIDHLVTVLTIQEKLNAIKKIFVIGDSDTRYPSVSQLFRSTPMEDDEVRNEFDGEPSRDLSKTTVFMVPTSGTTGRPKLVEHTHRSYLSSFHIGDPYMNVFCRNDVLVTWASLTHVTGVWKMGGCLHAGAALVVTRFDNLPTYDDMRTICNRYQVTTFMIFPTMSRVILMNANGEPTMSVRNIICAGSRATPGLEHLMRRWFPNLKQLRNLLGQTEAMIYVSITPSGEFDLRSIGYPPSNCQLRLLDTETGEEVASGEIGEIVIKSPSLMKGYFQNPCETSAVFTEDGWLKTGDLAYQDSVTGRYYYVDRIKEMIFCKDNRIYPGELEIVLMEHMCVAEAAVIGVPHPAIGEAPAALVELKNGTQPSEQLRKEIADLVESQLASFKVLYGGVHFVERLPRTELNKVARRRLRELLPDIAPAYAR